MCFVSAYSVFGVVRNDLTKWKNYTRQWQSNVNVLSKYKVPFLIYQLIHAFACYSFIVFISSFIFTYTGWLVYWISNEDLSIFRTACEQAYCLFEATHGFNSKM